MPTYRHRVTGTFAAGDVWTTSLHSNGAATLAAAHTAWTTFVNGFVGTTLLGLWPNETAATEVVTDQMDPITGRNVAQLRSSISQVGTGTGQPLPPRDSLVIGLRTALPTKGGRGRMYWPTPDAGHLTSVGVLVTADATTIATGFASRLTTFKATVTPVIWHQGSKTYDTVIQTSVGNVLGSQRRRSNKIPNSYSLATV
jgi:hypothetical protein